ncbi:transposase [Nonomuraea sp. NPDC049714]|uniref:transposase n=1 Tax=Nonomuraea sp. NPDC049714 TaxID=3364357 RepID=UPI0037AC6AA8
MNQGGLAERGKAARDQDAWLYFEDEAGQALKPPKARTWSRRGSTPVVTVTGKGSGRVSVVGLICLERGQRTRLTYRMLLYRGRGERKGFRDADYARLLDAAHQQLGGPIVLVWDNLTTHRDALMSLAYRCSTCPPTPRTQSHRGRLVHPKRSLGNLTSATLDQLGALIRTRLKRMQCRSSLLEAFVADTDLAITGTHNEP